MGFMEIPLDGRTVEESRSRVQLQLPAIIAERDAEDKLPRAPEPEQREGRLVSAETGRAGVRAEKDPHDAVRALFSSRIPRGPAETDVVVATEFVRAGISIGAPYAFRGDPLRADERYLARPHAALFDDNGLERTPWI